MNKISKINRKHLLKILNCKQKGLTDDDFYINTSGNVVLTETYHQKRGYCCKKTCQHCPWKFQPESF
jgi:hypothetical protein